MKKVYERPMVYVSEFETTDYVASCVGERTWTINCNAGHGEIMDLKGDLRKFNNYSADGCGVFHSEVTLPVGESPKFNATFYDYGPDGKTGGEWKGFGWNARYVDYSADDFSYPVFAWGEYKTSGKGKKKTTELVNCHFSTLQPGDVIANQS